MGALIAGTIVVTAAVVEALAFVAAPVVVGIAVLLIGPAPLDDADTASANATLAPLAPVVVDGFNTGSPSALAFATPAGPAGSGTAAAVVTAVRVVVEGAAAP